MLKVLFLLMTSVWADEGGKVYAHKVFTHVANTEAVHVLVHTGGHLNGQPFVIHLRPDCEQKGSNWRKLNIEMAESACFVDRNAIELNRRTQEIFVKVKKVDQEDYSKQLSEDPLNLKPKCEKESSILRFDLKELCQDSKSDEPAS
jgi:hypothetical protein